MGVGGIGIWQLLIILAIVIMLFGTKRLRTLGSDMGAAIKGFRSTMKPEDSEQAEDPDSQPGSAEAGAEDNTEKK
ncbi:MAG: twin-arginine translocase TatA/TatE family subunit [Gammaproteobacteria bacterium]|nr:twin-arginine translocase TatA/TatE family subunit [Gammaproteobacteria bacterium]